MCVCVSLGVFNLFSVSSHLQVSATDPKIQLIAGTFGIQTGYLTFMKSNISLEKDKLERLLKNPFRVSNHLHFFITTQTFFSLYFGPSCPGREAVIDTTTPAGCSFLCVKYDSAHAARNTEHPILVSSWTSTGSVCYPELSASAVAGEKICFDIEPHDCLKTTVFSPHCHGDATQSIMAYTSQ